MLVETLLAFVRRDTASPGMRGVVAIGVARRNGPADWLRIQLGASAQAERVPELPRDATSALLVGEREAESLVRGTPLPAGAPFAHVYGDATLLSRFLERYLSRRDVIRARSRK